MKRLFFVLGILVLFIISFFIYRHYYHSQSSYLSNTSYPTQNGSSLSLSCQPSSIEEVIQGARGHRVSPTDPNIIYYDAKNSSGIIHVHQYNLLTKQDICLTCNNNPGKNPTGNNDGVSQIDPTGRYMTIVVEMDKHPGNRAYSTPGQGWFLNIWGWDMSLNKWYNLTNYPDSIAPNYEVHGVLLPRLSHDGKKIAWAEIYSANSKLIKQYVSGSVTTGAVWGNWRINVADINFSPNNISLSNIHQFTPGNADYYETESWTPDDKKVVVSSDIGQDSPLKSNIYLIDASNGNYTPFTNTQNEWNEQIQFSPDGTKSVFMSSSCCSFYNANTDWHKSLATELYLANTDGTNPVQLTHFNTPGYPEYNPNHGLPTEGTFSNDGKYLLFNSTDMSTGNVNLYKLNFKGVCGGV